MEDTKGFHLLALRGALRLELAGMKRSKGRSAYAMAKEAYNLRGGRKEVLDQLNAMVQARNV